MILGVPQICREPTDYSEDCFFCTGDASSLKAYIRKVNTSYPDIPSSIALVPQSDSVPEPDHRDTACSSSTSTSSDVSLIRDDTDPKVNIESVAQDERPHYPNRSDLNDWNWRLGLP